MYCPQCATESSSDLKYCRTCGANLKVIGKAVTLSEAIARSDGVPAKIKELMSNIKIAHVTEEVSRAMDKMNKEIASSSHDRPQRSRWRKEKTPEERRERHLVKGTIKLFWGGGLSIFLYFLMNALVLRLPPDVIASTPFEIEPVVHVLWLIGLVPMLSGVGHIIAGLTIRQDAAARTAPAIPSEPQRQIEFPEQSPFRIDQEPLRNSRPDEELTVASPREAPSSVTDRTTNILEHRVSRRQTNGIAE